jgi:tetratricopeptide (TPR) repeat protein
MRGAIVFTNRNSAIGILLSLWFCFAIVCPRAAVAQNAEVRSVTIVSEPNATVWIDGLRYGATDESGRLTVSSVVAGRHTIRVRANGFKDGSKVITAAQAGEIAIPLKKTTDEGELAFQQGEVLSTVDRAKAAEAYLKAIKLKPGYTDAYIGLARVYFDGGKLEDAEKVIRDVRKIKPALPETSVIMGRIYKGWGEEEKAIAEFKRAIKEGRGTQPEAYTGLGLLYNDRAEASAGAGDFEQEAANYAEAAKNFSIAAKQLGGSPDAVVVYQLLGLVYERQKKNTEAIAVYQDFLRIFPDIPESTTVRSFIEQLRKQSDQPK